MFRITVLLVAATSLTACTRRQQDFAWFATAVAVEVAKAAATAPSYEGGTGVAEAAPDPDSYPPPSPADLQRAHDIAWELTRTAAHDARADNCNSVVRASNQVRVIDPAVFANVFLRDVPIQRCLALAPEPALTSGLTVTVH